MPAQPIYVQKPEFPIDHVATGKMLRKIREDNGVNQKDLAKKLKISGPALFYRESGDVELTAKFVEQYENAVMKLKK